MQRMSLLLFAWLVLAFADACAAPARPLYEPPDPPKAPPARAIFQLEGSAWLGKYNAINRIFILEADGTLSYKSATLKGKGNAIKNRGSWKLEGDQLFFQHHIKPGTVLMEFRGTIKDGNTIVGEAIYPLLNGNKANQTLQRTTLELK